MQTPADDVRVESTNSKAAAAGPVNHRGDTARGRILLSKSTRTG